MMFGRMNRRKWDPGILFPNGMGCRALLIVGVQCKKWDPGIVLVPLISIIWETIGMGDGSPLNKVILTRLVQQQSWCSSLKSS